MNNERIAGVERKPSLKQKPSRQIRRSIRLRGYDYSRAGAYFVTICAQNRLCLFGDVVDGKMLLNYPGRMVKTVWDELTIRFPYLELDECVVMLNHVHGIFVLHRRGEPCVRPEPCVRSESANYHKSGEHKVRPYIGTDSTSWHNSRKGQHKGRPHGTLPGTVGRIVQAFKSITTHEYINGVKQYGWQRFHKKLWQRSYYEHIIRNEKEMNHAREYIVNNPARWESDRENPYQAH